MSTTEFAVFMITDEDGTFETDRFATFEQAEAESDRINAHLRDRGIPSSVAHSWVEEVTPSPLAW